jgi:cob(I)alamin adenosyltransferase
MSKIITKLVGIPELPKNSPILDAIGTVEELNASIGVVIAYVWDNPDAMELLMEVQKDLIVILEDYQHISTKTDKRLPHKRYREIKSQTDKYNEILVEPKGVVIPGGTPASAHCHLSRTLCRRAERAYAKLACDGPVMVNGNIGLYLNELDHLLFALARILSEADNLLLEGSNEKGTESAVSGTAEVS